MNAVTSLAAGDVRLLARAVFHLLAARAGLALRSAHCLRPKSPPAARHAAPAFPPARASWAVEAVARRLPETRCLARALALRSLLGSEGFAADLRIGVAGAGPSGMRAHAWIECDGATFDCGEDTRGYAPFPALPR